MEYWWQKKIYNKWRITSQNRALTSLMTVFVLFAINLFGDIR